MSSQFFKNFKQGMEMFGQIISTIINSLLLFLVYIIGVGLTSIISKFIFRKHFLDLKISKDKETYWEDLNLGNKKIGDYYRQF